MTVDEFKLKMEDVAATTAATTAVGGGIMWLVREKLATWVRRVNAPVTNRVEGLERRMTARETHDEVQAAVLENIQTNMGDGFARITRSLEKLDERLLDLSARR